MNFKYLIGSILSIPFLPIMYLQGKRIRATVPKLPEAKGIEGIVKQNPLKTLRILTIGESAIAGVGVETHEEGLTGTIAKTLAKGLNTNVHWKVYAKSGYTAKRVTYKILPTIEETTTDLIVVGLGGNDAFKLNTPGKWRAQMQTLIETLSAKFPDSPICFLNMPPIKEFPAFTSLMKATVGNLVELFGQELHSLTKERKNVFYLSEIITFNLWIKELKSRKRSDFFSDGVHPSKFTYQTWGNYFGAYLLENQCIRELLDKKLKANIQGA